MSSPKPLPAEAPTAWTRLRRPWLPCAVALLGTIGNALQGCLLYAGCTQAAAALQPQSDVMLMEALMGVPHR